MHQNCLKHVSGLPGCISDAREQSFGYLMLPMSCMKAGHCTQMVLRSEDLDHIILHGTGEFHLLHWTAILAKRCACNSTKSWLQVIVPAVKYGLDRLVSCATLMIVYKVIQRMYQHFPFWNLRGGRCGWKWKAYSHLQYTYLYIFIFYPKFQTIV